MIKQRILIVEDEEKIARVLELELEHEGYHVAKVGDGLAALEAYRTKQWDLILLDVMLPEMNGIDVLRRIRKDDPDTPVLMLTAKGGLEDKVAGLDMGANDYVTKPFQIEELLARIRSVLRHRNVELQSEAVNQWLTAADLKLNEVTREVMRGDQHIELTPREFELLVYLLHHKRQVLNRDQILEAVWGYDYFGDTNVVDVYVRYLRKKINQEQQPDLIHTVRGVGYVIRDTP